MGRHAMGGCNKESHSMAMNVQGRRSSAGARVGDGNLVPVQVCFHIMDCSRFENGAAGIFRLGQQSQRNAIQVAVSQGEKQQIWPMEETILASFHSCKLFRNIHGQCK